MADQQMAAFNQGPMGFIPGQIQGSLGQYGACDPQFRDAASALLNYRYSTAYFELVYDAGPTAYVQVAADTEVEAFVAGVDESGSDQGKSWTTAANLKLSETDCYKEGALVEKGQMYVAVGMTASVGRPFYPSTTVKIDRPLIDEYDARIRQAFLSGVGIEYVYGNTACRYRLGNLGQWPAMSGAAGDAVVSNGTPMAGAFNPFRAATVVGARDEAKKLTVKLKVGDTLRFEQNGAAPFTNVATPNGLTVPVMLQLIGFPICAQDASACGIPGSDANDVATIIAALKAQGKI